MIYEIMRSINNCFEIPGAGQTGTWEIINGELTLPFLSSNQFFLIEGSAFNDGLHRYPEADLEDETFTGTIYPLAVPRSFIALTAEIEEWQEKYGAVAIGPYSSESFGGYSYTKAKTGNSDGASGATWELAFKSKLDNWRKL